MEPQVMQAEQSGTREQIGNNLGTLISITVRDLKELKASIKLKAKELQERLGLNPKYAEINEQYKELGKDRRMVKVAVIKNDSHMSDLDTVLKSLKTQKKELENKLSDTLIEFGEQTGQMSFLDDDGNTIEFERVAKIRSIV